MKKSVKFFPRGPGAGRTHGCGGARPARLAVGGDRVHREGHAVARCTVERLMRRRGLRGVIRGKVVRITFSDPKVPCPPDKVNRQFKADRPNHSGSRTSPASRHGRAGCPWPSSSTSADCSRAWSGGDSGCRRSSRLTRKNVDRYHPHWEERLDRLDDCLRERRRQEKPDEHP